MKKSVVRGQGSAAVVTSMDKSKDSMGIFPVVALALCKKRERR